MSLIIETQPTAEPVTLAEVKARLRLTTTDDDATIAQHITAAREYAEKITRRSLAKKGYAAYFERFPAPGCPLRVPAPPLLTVDSIKYLDSSLTLQTWDPAEYYVADKQVPALIIPKPTFVYPCPALVPQAVEVHFHAGYDASGQAIPEVLRLAIMQLAGHYYDHPEIVSSEAQNIIPRNLSDILTAHKVYVF